MLHGLSSFQSGEELVKCQSYCDMPQLARKYDDRGGGGKN